MGDRRHDYPPLLPEFENPLFLKTFAEAFSGREIPAGTLSLDRVMSQRIRVTCEHIQRKIDCPFDATESALSWLAGPTAANPAAAKAVYRDQQEQSELPCLLLYHRRQVRQAARNAPDATTQLQLSQFVKS